jgi:hypothetical protein
MKCNYRPFRQPRAACLRAGKLLDISSVARQAFVEVPMAITPQLWGLIAGEDPFRVEDPRLLNLCWTVLLTVVTNAATRQEFLPYLHTLWTCVLIGQRKVEVKLMTHPGDDPEPVMTILSAEEELVMQ